MAIIRQEDFIRSVADALQFISCYHPADYVRALGEAWEREESEEARDAMAQILVNSRMSAEGRRPMCQDTGIVVVYLRVGMDVRWEADLAVADMVNEGVRRAYLDPDNVLRASIVDPPFGARRNTGDNTPAAVQVELVPGGTVDVRVAAKGGGSENKARFAMLNPSDGIVDWVLRTVPGMGAGWCPPGMLGLGIGGTAEKAMVLAKEALLDPIDMHELIARGPKGPTEELRVELYEKVNALGIGAQGLGGLTTVLDVKVKEFPHPRGGAAGRDDPQLRRDPASAFRARRERPRRVRAAEPGGLAGGDLGGGRGRDPGEPRTADEGGGGGLEAGGSAAPEWPAPDRARRGPQADRGSLRAGRAPPRGRGLHEPGDLLRGAGGSGPRRGGGAGRSDHRDPHGQVSRR